MIARAWCGGLVVVSISPQRVSCGLWGRLFTRGFTGPRRDLREGGLCFPERDVQWGNGVGDATKATCDRRS